MNKRIGMLLLSISLLALPVSATSPLMFEPLATHDSGAANSNATQMAVYEIASETLYILNSSAQKIDILNISEPAAPVLVGAIDLASYGGWANAIAVYSNVLAVAIENEDPAEDGIVAFFGTAGSSIRTIEVGAGPSALAFSPNGRWLVVANEGEPNASYSTDPQGSVSILSFSIENGSPIFEMNSTISFEDVNIDVPLSPHVRVYGPGATPAQDFEPESVAISLNSTTAYVTLQENNALAVIDLESASLRAVAPMGSVDYQIDGPVIDIENDGDFSPSHYPVQGLYQPDGVAVYSVAGQDYVVTANEGTLRDYTGFQEAALVSELTLDTNAFPEGETFQRGGLGDVTVTISSGDSDDDGDYEALYLPGTRSFSIWAANGSRVYDSGTEFEQQLNLLYPEERARFDAHSPLSGPEPEDVTVATIGGRDYAFISLKTVGGVMIYDVSNPMSPSFATYLPPFIPVEVPEVTETPEVTAAPDVTETPEITETPDATETPEVTETPEATATAEATATPEATEAAETPTATSSSKRRTVVETETRGSQTLLVIPAEQSPNSEPLLVVSDAETGITSIYAIGVGF